MLHLAAQREALPAGIGVAPRAAPWERKNADRSDLRRDASCHTGRKGDIDPHSLAQITETYRQSEGIQDNGIVIYVKLQLVCRGNSALPWDGIGDKDISGVVI